MNLSAPQSNCGNTRSSITPGANTEQRYASGLKPPVSKLFASPLEEAKNALGKTLGSHFPLPSSTIRGAMASASPAVPASAPGRSSSLSATCTATTQSSRPLAATTSVVVSPLASTSTAAPTPTVATASTTATTAAASNTSSAPADSVKPRLDRRDNNAQSKRCRFALRDSTGKTPPDSQVTKASERRSRSPGPKPSRGVKVKEACELQGSNKVNGSNLIHVKTVDVLPFKPPLRLEKAEEIIMVSLGDIPGDVVCNIHDKPIRFLPGSSLYLQRNANLSLKDQNELNQDGYNWTEILHQEALSTSRGNRIDYRHYYITGPSFHRQEPLTSSRFRRESYTLNDVTLIAYIGDEREPEVLNNQDPAISFTFSSLPRSQRYDGEGSKHLSPFHPQSQATIAYERQSKPSTSLDRAELNRRAFLDHEQRMQRFHPDSMAISTATNSGRLIGRQTSPPPLAITYETHGELVCLAERLASGKLVKNLTLFPSIQITLVHPEMTKEFENACQLLYHEPWKPELTEFEPGIHLFYDITFSVGKLYATVLTFAHSCYEGNPIFPLAINLHEGKFKSSHQLFWARVVGDIPALQKHRFPLFIDDAEPAVHLAVRLQAPNLVQLEGWTHRFRDIDIYLRSKGYGEEAINYFKACVCYLLSAKSKQAMHDRFRKEFEFVWPRDFVQYYREKLLPRSGRLGRWVMNKMNIHESYFLSPHTNPQESFHRTCRHFVGWENLSIDQLIRASELLFLFFVYDIRTGGAYGLKEQFRSQYFQHSVNPIMNCRVPHPSEISDYVKEYFPPRRMPLFQQHNQKQLFSQLDSVSMGAMTPRAGAVGPGASSGAQSLSSSLLAYGSSQQHFAATRGPSGIQEVLQLESALENMFCDDDSDDEDTHLELDTLASLCLPHSSLHHSSAVLNASRMVPSPAPNGQVPSPAPAGDPLPPQAQLVSEHRVHCSSRPTAATSTLTTIPEVPQIESRLGHQGMIPNGPPPPPAPTSAAPQIVNASGDSVGGYPPDLLAHSSFQDHSFDSSIVTEGHYDASFESEVPPRNESAVLAPTPAVSSSHGHALIRPAMKPLPAGKHPVARQTSANVRLPVIEGSKKNSVGSDRRDAGVQLVGPTQGGGQCRGPIRKTVMNNNSGLMLWKKVQHYVVVGGSFVNAASLGKFQNQSDPNATTHSATSE